MTRIYDHPNDNAYLVLFGRGVRLNRKQQKAMYAKAPLNQKEWEQIIASHHGIVKDQNQVGKYSDKVVNRSNGVMSQEIDRLNSARDRLDKKLPKLASKYGYVPKGYTQYDAGVFDHYPPNHFKR
jgi:hypothetical protein